MDLTGTRSLQKQLPHSAQEAVAHFQSKTTFAHGSADTENGE